MRERQHGYLGVIVGLLILGALLSTTGPERTAIVSPALAGDEAAVVGVLNTFAPLGPEQERHLVVAVEAFGGHDNAFSTWTYDTWQRWPAEGVRQVSIIVRNPDYQPVVHIVLDGTRPLLTWEPRNALNVFDVPLEFSAYSRAFAYTGEALTYPDEHHLTREQADGQELIHFTWVDHYAAEFGYINRGTLTVDHATQQARELLWKIDRPEQDPYPIRRFTIATVELLPPGASDDVLFTLDGNVLTRSALITP